MFYDNKAVSDSSMKPEHTLSKKHKAVAYHKCREAIAMGIIRVRHEDTYTNLSDLLTKFKSKPDRERLINLFMH